MMECAIAAQIDSLSGDVSYDDRVRALYFLTSALALHGTLTPEQIEVIQGCLMEMVE